LGIKIVIFDVIEVLEAVRFSVDMDDVRVEDDAVDDGPCRIRPADLQSWCTRKVAHFLVGENSKGGKGVYCAWAPLRVMFMGACCF